MTNPPMKIEIGQRWVSKDRRDQGRTVTVVQIDGAAFVWVKYVRRTRIRTENLRKLYRLVGAS